MAKDFKLLYIIGGIILIIMISQNSDLGFEATYINNPIRASTPTGCAQTVDYVQQGFRVTEDIQLTILGGAHTSSAGVDIELLDWNGDTIITKDETDVYYPSNFDTIDFTSDNIELQKDKTYYYKITPKDGWLNYYCTDASYFTKLEVGGNEACCNPQDGNCCDYLAMQVQGEGTGGLELCSDSDSGNDIFNKGTVTTQGQAISTYDDTCIDSNTVKEYWCNDPERNIASSLDIDCPTGNVCQLGACVESTNGGDPGDDDGGDDTGNGINLPSFFTDEMIAGIPNWMLMIGGFFLLMIVMSLGGKKKK